MEPVTPVEPLTRRELQVLWLIAGGSTYAKAALQLGISAHTVAAHIKNIYRKLEVHTAGAAVMRAVNLRLLGLDRAP
jgi:DNA-binding CsgD family transcriptional regulator